MKLAYFPGCKIDFYLKEYDITFKSIMEKLSVELVELPFNCCGYPARDNDNEVSLFSSIRNLAIAGEYNLDIITPCKCCYGHLQHASLKWKNLRENREGEKLKQKFNSLLTKEKLSWNENIRIKHLLPFLYHDIGIQEIKKRIKKRLPEKRVVTQYGCHALRPSSVTEFDNPHAPRIFEELINITGYKSVEWSKSTECCGNPVLEKNQSLSMKIVDSKLDAAKEVKADYICTACTHCQIQYSELPFQKDCEKPAVTPVLFTQILDNALKLN